MKLTIKEIVNYTHRKTQVGLVVISTLIGVWLNVNLVLTIAFSMSYFNMFILCWLLKHPEEAKVLFDG